ncbi:MAG: hypothetical protein ABMA13_01555 [Chthoniobacteraceae bacterium]
MNPYNRTSLLADIESLRESLAALKEAGDSLVGGDTRQRSASPCGDELGADHPLETRASETTSHDATV